MKKTVPGKFTGASFDDFKNELLNKEAIETIIQWANDFPTDFTKKAYPSIYIFSGVNGVGKTHLAAATINELANRDKDKDWGSWGYHFETITSIKNAVKESQKPISKTSTQSIYDELTAKRLLVLDDVGKDFHNEYQKAFITEMYYQIINGCYEKNRSILFTSNIPFDTPYLAGGETLRDLIGEDCMDRLRGMTRGQVIELKGESRRLI